MSSTVHVVRRIFGLTSADEYSRGLVRAFVRAEAARAWIAEREKDERARGDVNPFHFSEDLADCTTMPAEVLHDWLLDHDYPAHDLNGPLGWEDWWDAHVGGFTPAQRERLWGILDRVRFFQVRPVGLHRCRKAPHRILVRTRRRRQNGRGQFVDKLRIAVEYRGGGSSLLGDICIPLDAS
jgi:hypothetical protein